MTEPDSPLLGTDAHNKHMKRMAIVWLSCSFVVAIALTLVPLFRLIQGTGSQANLILSVVALMLLGGLSVALLFGLFFLVSKLEDTKLRDAVSGSISYSAFLDRATDLLMHENGSVRRMMVHFDLDRFKLINDMYGYRVADDFLRKIAQVLEANLAADEPFCRAYADHFVMLLSCPDRPTLERRIMQIHHDCPQLPAEDDTIVRQVGIHCGVYETCEIGHGIRLMDERANIACREAEAMRKQIVFYDERSLESMVMEQNIETTMEYALDNRQFLLFLQPKYNLATGEACGAEALVRWVHPTRGLLLPDQFLPTFERTGFIRKIDLYMFEQVCITMRRWLDMGIHFHPVSVNISRSHLDDLDLVPVLSSLAMYYRVPHNLIELEITENSFRDDEGAMMKMLTGLKAEGFPIAMDDFGTGFSTLNILKDIPLDTLKLDKGFLDECVVSERGRSVITDVVTMAKHLQMHVISEGIETEEQYEFLRGIGCELGQGFYFSRPIDVAAYEQDILGIPCK